MVAGNSLKEGLKRGPTEKKTALREICEETGLKKKDLNIIKPLIPTHHHNKVNGDIMVKETFWFLIQYSSC